MGYSGENQKAPGQHSFHLWQPLEGTKSTDFHIFHLA